MRYVLVSSVLLVATIARADERPWDRGVTASARAEAERLEAEGRELYVNEEYLDSVAKFEAAIALWPDPALHYSAALGLMKLTRWVEAAHHLELSLAFGEAGLGQDFDRARARLAESVSHTGKIEVASRQRGAELSVDGKVALVAPGSASVRVAPGRHVVLAKRADLVSEPVAVEVAAGQTLSAEPVLYTTDTSWRWARWKPWGVVGVGLAIAIAGAPMLVHAITVADEYKREIDEECMFSCPVEPPRLAAIRERSERWRAGAVGAFVGGGVITALGLVWVGLNSQIQQKTVATDIAVVPQESGGSLVLTHRW